jgi:methylisocitrate lyase
MANMTEFGRSPALTVHELARLGCRLVLCPMTAFRVAAYAVEQALNQLRENGTSVWSLPRMQTRKQLYALNRYADFDRREKDFLKQAKLTMKGKK